MIHNTENLSLAATQKEVSKGAKIRNPYNQVPHLTQDTNGKVTKSQIDTTNESQEVSPFSAGDHKAHTNRRAQRHSKHKTEKDHKTEIGFQDRLSLNAGQKYAECSKRAFCNAFDLR